MPIYEYECLKNKHRFEVIQKFSDPPVLHCTVCGEAVQRLLSSPAIHFKGTGWYVTDYAPKGKAGSDSSKKESRSGEKESKAEAAKSGSDSSSETPSTAKDSSSKPD
jgi:putative FmdB family regulatory protein